MNHASPLPKPPRRRKPRNPKVVARDLSYYADGATRISDHTSFRMPADTRAKLRELAARVYGGTSQSTVIRLLIETAWAKLKAGDAELDPRNRMPKPKPAPETVYRDPTPESLAQESGMSVDQLRGLLRLKAELDPESGIPVAMVQAWDPFDHRPWVPGLRRIWAWVQSREVRLRRLLSRPGREVQSDGQ